MIFWGWQARHNLRPSYMRQINSMQRWGTLTSKSSFWMLSWRAYFGKLDRKKFAIRENVSLGASLQNTLMD